MILGFVIAVALTVSAGVLGLQVIMKLQRYLTVITLVMTAVYIALTFSKVDWQSVQRIEHGSIQGLVGAIIFGATRIDSAGLIQQLIIRAICHAALQAVQ
jgi:purine-cytosine permease-like protein